jgi:hypothetical protein
VDNLDVYEMWCVHRFVADTRSDAQSGSGL